MSQKVWGNRLTIQKLKEKEKKERINYIVDMAEQLFFLKGYDNVSMKDIAEEVGISRAALYLYFKNKETVYLAIVLRAVKIRDKLFRESVKTEKNGLDKLKDIGRAYFKFYNEFNDYYSVCLYFNSERFDKSDDEYVPEIRAFSSKTIQIMREAVDDGIKDGSIRADLNPLEVAIFIATTSKQVVKINSHNLKALKSEGISYEQYKEDSLDLWANMVMNKS